MSRETLRDFSGKILGYYETNERGEILLRDFSLKILGKYDPKRNVTTDFYGRMIGKGNLLSMLLH